MGASGSVLRLENVSAEEVGSYVANIGKEYKVYKPLFVDKGVSGARLRHLKTVEDIVEVLKSIGIKNASHQKVLCTQLMKLIQASPPEGGAGGGGGAGAGGEGGTTRRKSFQGTLEGIRASVVADFLASCGGKEKVGEMTVSEVCERFLKPKTLRNHSAFIDILKSQTHPGLGLATTYVSHSWSSSFIDLADALDAHTIKNPDAVYWLDLFCTNQHVALNFEKRNNLIRHTISQVGHVLLFLSPWQNPVSFTRAWCLHEMAQASERCASVSVAMARRDEEGFLAALRLDFDAFDQIIAAVDLDQLEAHTPTDKAAIVDYVTRNIDVNGINRIIFEQLREWAVNVTRGAVEEEEDEDSKLELSITLSGLLRGQGKYADAELLLVWCLEKLRKDCGEDHPDTLACMNNLAAIYEHQGKFDKAEGLLVKCLSLCSRTIGPEDPITLTVMSSLADAYSTQRKFVEAEPLYIRCLDISTRQLGPTHSDTLASKNNLAYLYINQKKYAQAEPLLVSCYEARQAELGGDHPDSLASMNNLAFLYKSQGKLDQAEPLYEDCLEMHRIKLGVNHPSTLSTMAGLAALYDAKKEVDKAEQLFKEACEKGRSILGDNHPSVQEWEFNYDRFVRQKNGHVLSAKSFRVKL